MKIEEILIMTVDTDSGDFGSGDEESTPLLFPSLRPQLNYKDLQSVHYGTADANIEYCYSKSGKNTYRSKLKDILSKPIAALRKKCQKYIGILLAIFASFLLSLTTLIARVLIEYHPFNEAMWRFLGILLPSVPILFWNNLSRKEEVLGSVYPCCDADKLKTFLVIFVSLFIIIYHNMQF